MDNGLEKAIKRILGQVKCPQITIQKVISKLHFIKTHTFRQQDAISQNLDVERILALTKEKIKKESSKQLSK